MSSSTESAGDEARLEKGTRRVVVFDTNVYRRLAFSSDVETVRERMSRLREDERRKGIQALAHTDVALELLARLADPNGSSYVNVKAAVVGLFEHCHGTLNGERHLAIVPDPDLQLCLSLYGRQDELLLGGLNILQSMVKIIAENPSEETLDRIRPDLQTLAVTVEATERRFVRDMKVHLGEDPDADEWRPMASDRDAKNRLLEYLQSPEAEVPVVRSFVMRAQRFLKVEETEGELEEKTRWLRQHLKVPVRIYNQWLVKALRDNADPAKPERANTLWDLHICFSVGDEHTIKGCPVWLVTDEKKLREAAAEVTSMTLMLAYDEYRERLALGNFA